MKSGDVLKPTAAVAAALLVLLCTTGCDTSYPELEGTYPGRFGIDKWGEVSGGTRYLACGGPGVIEITSTDHGIIAGTWDFGPDTTVAALGRRNCGEDWHYAGELRGWVRSESEVILAFYYQDNDLIPEIFNVVLERGQANAWPASTKGGGLMLALNWHDCPGLPGEHWCISFHAWRQ
jgi:hypothetical protein